MREDDLRYPIMLWATGPDVCAAGHDVSSWNYRKDMDCWNKSVLNLCIANGLVLGIMNIMLGEGNLELRSCLNFFPELKNDSWVLIGCYG